MTITAAHSATHGERAIVIGASLSGLLAARALADFFHEVVVLERDRFPAPGENRKGVPQGKHAHGLLARGREIMEGYFPGLTSEMEQHGALPGDVALRARWHNQGGYMQHGESGEFGVLLSRPRLEALIRGRLLALPNVRAIEGASVLGLVAAPDKRRVTGVRLMRSEPGSAEETLAADLTVDATGRGSRTPAWLEDLGYPRPPEEKVQIDMGYTTCWFRRPADPQIRAYILAATPPNKRSGVMLAQEENRWVVSIGGHLGDHAPLDLPGFLEYAKNLPAPEIYDLIKDAEPLGEPVPYRFPANQRRRYEKLSRFPEGYLVIGDGLSSFNPIYGQGMSVAAMEAVALSDCLRQGGNGLARRFFARAAKAIDVPWSIAVGNDLRFPEVEGPRTPMVRFVNWYVGKLHHAAHRDLTLSVAFLRVVNLLAPPGSLMRPAVLWRVIRGNIGGRSPATPSAVQAGYERISTK